MDNPEGDEPAEPSPEDCCGEGCSPCVWDVYREKLKKHLAKKQETAAISASGLSKVEFSACQLVAVQEQSKDTSVYRFKTTKGVTNFFPGHHLEIRVLEGTGGENEIIRKYSPIYWGQSTFDVLIKRYENGKVSKLLENAKIGDDFFWRGPYGNFKYRRDQQKLLLLLCVGTGIAPMIPIIREIINDDEDETVITLLCGCSTLDNRLLLDELKELAAYWNFSFAHFVNSTELKTGWGEKVEWRRIQESDVQMAIKNPDKCFALICGTDSFCTDMKNIVSKLGASFYCF